MVLPDLIELEHHGGDWIQYLEAVYDIFRFDFLARQERFRGRRVAIKRHPEYDGKAATFWHLISSGFDEGRRLPDMRRCERIGWPRAFIADSTNSDLKVWMNTRKGDRRVLLFNEDERYLVVLSLRKDYVLLWTAYCVDRDHQVQKLLSEYEKAGAFTLL